MFFAPPKVKSLSRYSEFGIYLDHRHFLTLLAIAATIHFSIIGIYAMLPREEVLKIPVRVMNIKLTGGGGTVMPANMPAPPQVVAAGVPEAQPAAQEHPAVAALHHSKAAASKPSSKPVVVDNTHTKASKYEPAADNSATAADPSLSTPKQYVREREMAGDGTGQGVGTGGGQGGTKGGDEIIQRYEQTISMWIKARKIYPLDAQGRGLAGDAIVRVRIDRAGHIIFREIEKSSGNPSIDAAAVNMVDASNPVPAAPSDYPADNQLEFLIPVNFTLH